MIKKLLSCVTAFVALVLCIGFSAKAMNPAVEVIYKDGTVIYADENLSELPTCLNNSDIIHCNILVDPESDRNDFFRIDSNTLCQPNALEKINNIAKIIKHINPICSWKMILPDNATKCMPKKIEKRRPSYSSYVFNYIKDYMQDYMIDYIKDYAVRYAKVEMLNIMLVYTTTAEPPFSRFNVRPLLDAIAKYQNKP